MIARPTDGGYTVDAQSLRGFAQLVGAVGQSVEELATQARSALALGAAGGLDIGVAITRAQAAWSTRLRQLASEAHIISRNLAANAGSYDQAESTARDAFTRILPDAGLAL